MSRVRVAPLAAPFGACVATGSGILLWIAGINPLPALAAAGGVAVALGALASAEIGVAALIAAVAVFQRESLFVVSVPFMGGGLKPTDILLALTLAGWAARSAAHAATRTSAEALVASPGRWPAPLPRPVTWLLLGFVAWAGLSALAGIMAGNGFKESLLELRPLLQYLLFVPIVASLGSRSIHRIVIVMLAAAAVSSLNTIALYIGGEGNEALFTGGGMRITAVPFAYMLFAFVFAVLLRAGGSRHRLLLYGLAILGLGGLAVTLFRAAFLGLAAALAFATWTAAPVMRRRLLRQAGLLLLALPIGAGALGIGAAGSPELVPALLSRIASVSEYNRDISAQHRLSEWSAAARIIAANPVTGAGLGARVEFYSPMYDEQQNRMGYWSSDVYVHNSYLWVLAKLGLIGFGLLTATIALSLRAALRAIRAGPPGPDHAVLIALTACIVAALVAAMFGPLLNTDNMTPFVAFALAAAHVLARSSHAGAPPGRPAYPAQAEPAPSGAEARAPTAARRAGP